MNSIFLNMLYVAGTLSLVAFIGWLLIEMFVHLALVFGKEDSGTNPGD